MSDAGRLAEVISAHSRDVFGRELAASALRVAPVARGTRGIYRVQAGTRAVIVKRRLPATPAEREVAAAETAREYALLSAVWSGMRAQGRLEHDVPRPLLALPGQGLLVMEQSRGTPLVRTLWRWLLGRESLHEVARVVERCGAWLHTFSTAPIAWPRFPPEEAAAFETRRARHHVYRLVGLSGSALPDAMLAGMERRLAAWKVDGALTPRIARAFSTRFADFAGAGDVQTAVHGKYSPADVFTHAGGVSGVDLEQAGTGSAYLDPAYFLYQVSMLTRWRPLGFGTAAAARLRRAFLAGRAASNSHLDERLLDCCIAYYLVNSLRPGGGVAGYRARVYAHRWLADWLAGAGV